MFSDSPNSRTPNTIQIITLLKILLFLKLNFLRILSREHNNFGGAKLFKLPIKVHNRGGAAKFANSPQIPLGIVINDR
jgi:hypothetical protein